MLANAFFGRMSSNRPMYSIHSGQYVMRRGLPLLQTFALAQCVFTSCSLARSALLCWRARSWRATRFNATLHGHPGAGQYAVQDAVKRTGTASPTPSTSQRQPPYKQGPKA
jgi:hypothetical protein